MYSKNDVEAKFNIEMLTVCIQAYKLVTWEIEPLGSQELLNILLKNF